MKRADVEGMRVGLLGAVRCEIMSGAKTRDKEAQNNENE